MANLPAELRALPLEHIIGAPLEAAIKAQAMAARTSVEFIREVGLKTDATTGELSAQYVDFKFDRTLEEMMVPPAGGQPIRNYRVVPSKLTVPLLAMVPVPYIRISDMTIDFEYQIRDIETSETQKEGTVEAKVGAKYWCVKAEVKGSYSNRSATKRETDRRTTLKIMVNAAQDQMPEGLSRVLDMLHDAMHVVPLSTGALLPSSTARIDSIAPMSVQMNTTGVKVTLKGSGLDGATKVSSDDALITNLTTVPALPFPQNTVSFDLTMDIGSTTSGDKTIVLDTPQGKAEVKLKVT
jgi:hypothetical protein